MYINSGLNYFTSVKPYQAIKGHNLVVACLISTILTFYLEYPVRTDSTFNCEAMNVNLMSTDLM